MMKIYEDLPGGISVAGQVDPLNTTLISSFGYFTGEPEDTGRIPDLAARAKSLLIEQFQERERINEIVEILVRQAQEIENELHILLTQRALTTAEGAQLDAIGSIVGIDRDGRNDEDYRAAIVAQIFINQTAGTPESIIAYVKLISLAQTVKFMEPYPAAVSVFTDGVNTVGNSELVTNTKRLLPAGVNLNGIIFGDPNVDHFIVDDEGGLLTDGLGFNELGYSPDVGGEMVELITS